MADIKQLPVVLRRQIDAIREVVNSPAISKPPQTKTITTIPKLPHHTSHIIENDDGYITLVHRVIVQQYNIHPHIISPETPQPRMMEKHLHVASPRVATIS